MSRLDRHRKSQLDFRSHRARRLLRARHLLVESLEDRRVLAASFPVAESFEVPDLASLSDWTFAGTNGAVVELEEAEAAQTGTKSLAFRPTVPFSNATVQATLEVDMSTVVGETDLSFDFWIKRLSLSSSSDFYSAVEVSGDGTSWTSLSPQMQLPTTSWVHYTYDLDARLADAGITLDTDVYFRFNHFGSHPIHEAIIDDVRIGQFDVAGPAVASITPDGLIPGPVSSVDITFTEPIPPTTLWSDYVDFTSPDGHDIAWSGVPVDSGDQTTYTFNFSQAESLRGQYNVNVSADVADYAGNPMNQNMDELNGASDEMDAFFGTFEVGPSTAQTLPYQQDFESPDLTALDGWSFAATDPGVINLGTVRPYSGAQTLEMRGGDGDNGGLTSTLLLDLQDHASATDLTLDFWAQRGNQVYPSDLTISASNDGANWADLGIAPDLETFRYNNFFYDLDERLDASNIVRDSDVYIRLTHSGFSNAFAPIDDLRVARRDADGPFVTGISPSVTVAGPISQFEITFNEPIDGTTFAAEDIRVLNVEGDALSLAGAPTDSGDQTTFSVEFATPQSVLANYRVSLGPNVSDLSGNPMNQDRDDANGESSDDQYEGQFSLGPPIAQSVPYFQDFEDPSLASLSGWSFDVSGAGTVELTTFNNPFSGSQHLQVTPRGVGEQHAVLLLDLQDQVGATDLVFDFRGKRLGSASSGNAITVHASGNGDDWTQLGLNISSDFGFYPNYFFDLDQELADASIQMDGDVYLRLGHVGGSTIYQAAFDDVRIANRDGSGAKIVSMTHEGSIGNDSISALTVTFDQPIDAATFQASDVVLDGPLGEIQLLNDPVNSGDDQTFNIAFVEPLDQAGLYRIAIGPDVRDLSGNPMNQDGDSVNADSNDAFQVEFEIDPIATTMFPYYQGFDNADELVDNWSFHSEPFGRNRLEVERGRSVLRMDNPNASSVNQAVLAMDLAGRTDVRVAFNLDLRNDNTTAGDAFRISDDQGETWHTVQGLFGNGWTSYDIDLDAAVSFFGLNYNSDFRIMVQQYGNGSWASDGRQLDDFRVTTETISPSVLSHSPTDLIRSPAVFDHLDLTFSESIDPSSFDLSDVLLTKDNVDISDQLLSITGSGTTFSVNFVPQGFGRYDVAILPGIVDLAGNPIDQDGDGNSGEFPDDRYTVSIDKNDPDSFALLETFDTVLPSASLELYHFWIWPDRSGRWNAEHGVPVRQWVLLSKPSDPSLGSCGRDSIQIQL